MTIDEVIAKYREITNTDAICPALCNISCEKCVQESDQIVEWLEELKAYRENYTAYIMEDIEVTQNTMYNKAIYDFAFVLKNNFEDLPVIISKDSFLDFINDNADLLIRGK